MEVEDNFRSFNIFLPCPADERKSIDLETNRLVPQYFL